MESIWRGPCHTPRDTIHPPSLKFRRVFGMAIKTTCRDELLKRRRTLFGCQLPKSFHSVSRFSFRFPQ
jgi:hypothetical protein